jgi:hypothetical protein
MKSPVSSSIASRDVRPIELPLGGAFFFRRHGTRWDQHAAASIGLAGRP